MKWWFLLLILLIIPVATAQGEVTQCFTGQFSVDDASLQQFAALIQEENPTKWDSWSPQIQQKVALFVAYKRTRNAEYHQLTYRELEKVVAILFADRTRAEAELAFQSLQTTRTLGDIMQILRSPQIYEIAQEKHQLAKQILERLSLLDPSQEYEQERWQQVLRFSRELPYNSFDISEPIADQLSAKIQQQNKHISERARSNKKISFLDLQQGLYVSPLTGIYNKRRYHEDIEEIVTSPSVSTPRARVYHKAGKTFKIVFEHPDGLIQIASFDIQDFKHQINARYGHLGGDRYLRATAQTLEELVRSWLGEEPTVFIQERVIQSSSFRERIIKDVGPLPVLEKVEPEDVPGSIAPLDPHYLNFYVGVSSPTSPVSTEAVQRANNDATLAGKTAQVGKIGGVKIEELSRIKDTIIDGIPKSGREIAQDVVDAAKRTPGSAVLEYIDGLEESFKNPALRDEELAKRERRVSAIGFLTREFEFFGEAITPQNLDTVVEARSSAVSSNEDPSALEDQILHSMMTSPDFDEFLDGLDIFKMFTNHLLDAKGQIDIAKVFIIGGDEIGFVISRQGRVRFARIDINNFGKANQRHGTEFGDSLKLQILHQIKEEINGDVDSLTDQQLSQRINLAVQDLIDPKMYSTEFVPSLSIGMVTVNDNFASVDADTFDAGTDAVSEHAKVVGKAELPARSTQELLEAGFFFGEATARLRNYPERRAFTSLEQLQVEWMLGHEEKSKQTVTQETELELQDQSPETAPSQPIEAPIVESQIQVAGPPEAPTTRTITLKPDLETVVNQDRFKPSRQRAISLLLEDPVLGASDKLTILDILQSKNYAHSKEEVGNKKPVYTKVQDFIGEAQEDPGFREKLKYWKFYQLLEDEIQHSNPELFAIITDSSTFGLRDTEIEIELSEEDPVTGLLQASLLCQSRSCQQQLNDEVSKLEPKYGVRTRKTITGKDTVAKMVLLGPRRMVEQSGLPIITLSTNDLKSYQQLGFLKLIGSGGNGLAFSYDKSIEGEDKNTVIKILDATTGPDIRSLRTYEELARLINAQSSGSTPQPLSLIVNEKNEVIGFEQELIAGQTLQNHIIEGEPLPPLVLTRLESALHKIKGLNVPHHDVHTGNMFITPEGELILIDFGPTGTDAHAPFNRKTILGLMPVLIFDDVADFVNKEFTPEERKKGMWLKTVYFEDDGQYWTSLGNQRTLVHHLVAGETDLDTYYEESDGKAAEEAFALAFTNTELDKRAKLLRHVAEERILTTKDTNEICKATSCGRVTRSWLSSLDRGTFPETQQEFIDYFGISYSEALEQYAAGTLVLPHQEYIEFRAIRAMHIRMLKTQNTDLIFHLKENQHETSQALEDFRDELRIIEQSLEAFENVNHFPPVELSIQLQSLEDQISKQDNIRDLLPRLQALRQQSQRCPVGAAYLVLGQATSALCDVSPEFDDALAEAEKAAGDQNTQATLTALEQALEFATTEQRKEVEDMIHDVRQQVKQDRNTKLRATIQSDLKALNLPLTLTEPLFTLADLGGHYDRRVLQIAHQMRPGDQVFAQAALVHDVGKNGYHKVVPRLFKVTVKKRIDKHITIKEFLEIAEEQNPQGHDYTYIRNNLGNAINPFTDLPYNLDDTMGDFWDAHSLWTAQHLKTHGVNFETIDTAIQHHRIDIFTNTKNVEEHNIIYVDVEHEEIHRIPSTQLEQEGEDIFIPHQYTDDKGNVRVVTAGRHRLTMSKKGKSVFLADQYDAYRYRSNFAHDAAIQTITNKVRTSVLGEEQFTEQLQQLRRLPQMPVLPLQLTPMQQVIWSVVQDYPLASMFIAAIEANLPDDVTTAAEVSTYLDSQPFVQVLEEYHATADSIEQKILAEQLPPYLYHIVEPDLYEEKFHETMIDEGILYTYDPTKTLRENIEASLDAETTTPLGDRRFQDQKPRLRTIVSDHNDKVTYKAMTMTGIGLAAAALTYGLLEVSGIPSSQEVINQYNLLPRETKHEVFRYVTEHPSLISNTLSTIVGTMTKIITGSATATGTVGLLASAITPSNTIYADLMELEVKLNVRITGTGVDPPLIREFLSKGLFSTLELEQDYISLDKVQQMMRVILTRHKKIPELREATTHYTKKENLPPRLKEIFDYLVKEKSLTEKEAFLAINDGKIMRLVSKGISRTDEGEIPLKEGERVISDFKTIFNKINGQFLHLPQARHANLQELLRTELAKGLSKAEIRLLLKNELEVPEEHLDEAVKIALNQRDVLKLRRKYMGGKNAGSIETLVKAGATSISYLKRGDSLMTIRNDGDQFVLEHTPIPNNKPTTLESRIKDAVTRLKEVEDVESKLEKAHYELAENPENKDLESRAQSLRDEHRTLLRSGVGKNLDSYRKITQGGEHTFPTHVLVYVAHLEQQQEAFEKVRSHIASEDPDVIIYSGRGGFPYRRVIKGSQPDKIHESIMTSSSLATEERHKYHDVGPILNRAIAQNTGEGPIKVTIIDGAQYSGSSIKALRTFLNERYNRPDNGKTPIEVTVYTFAQTETQDHFENLGELTESDLSENIEEKNIVFHHWKADIPFAIGEDAPIIGGTLTTGAPIESKAPIVIFDKRRRILEIHNIPEGSSTAQVFAEMLE